MTLYLLDLPLVFILDLGVHDLLSKVINELVIWSRVFVNQIDYYVTHSNTFNY
jgi:hypothetical protein